MAKKRKYKKNGPDLDRLACSAGEQAYIKNAIKNVALKVALKRKEAGLSQEQLAEMTELSVSMIRFIECRQRIPSLPVLAKIMYAVDRHSRIW